MRETLIALTAGAAFSLLPACGGPLHYQVHGTPQAPGADAEITADVSAGAKMTKLVIAVKNLAPPERLQPEGKAFVVWARHDPSGDWTRVGALHYDAGERQGDLAGASVPESDFELMVTVEDSPSPMSPSPSAIFSQQIRE